MSTSAVAAAAKATVVLAGSDGSDRINTPELGVEYSRNFLLTPNIHAEIKNEPPENIVAAATVGRTVAHADNYNYNNSNSNEGVGRGGEGNGNSNGTGGSDSPKIRLTPTVKLMAITNPMDPKRKFVCPYDNCTKSYGKSSHLRSHLTWHTGIKPFVCQEPSCGKGFTRSDELNRHVRTHTGEKPFECIQCTKKFSRSDHLTKHLATHAKQMQNTAAKRLRAAQENQVQLDSSGGGESNFNAGFSGGAVEPDVKKVLMDMENPTEHMSFNDGMHFMAALMDASKVIEGADGDVTSVGMPFRAQQLNALEEAENLTDEPCMAHQPIKIKLERPEHSGEYHVVPISGTAHTSHAAPTQPPPPLTPRPQLQPQQSQQHNPSRGYKVAHRCSVAAGNMNCLPQSVSVDIKVEPRDDAVMSEANVPPLLPYNAAITASGLIIPPHFQDYPSQTPYSPERPFRCIECTKCFKRQDDLNRHVRTHTGEKPYVCNECDRRFVRSDHLKKHMKTHTKVQPLPTSVASS